MSCIYYQDELAVCCKKGGLNWETREGSECDYGFKNMNDCPIGITIEQAENMKEKLDWILKRYYDDWHESDRYTFHPNYMKDLYEEFRILAMSPTSGENSG